MTPPTDDRFATDDEILAPLLERAGPLGVGFGVGKGLPS